MKTDKFDRLPPYLLIAAAAVLPYINALSNTFAWDDVYLVVKNPYIKGWHNVGHLFTTDYWESIGKVGGLYRPLTMLSFLIEHSVAGLNPIIYHLDNILLHTACSVLVYFVFRALLKDGHAPLIASLLFAVHPVHSEAVAWISGRAELLGVLFLLLAFLFFIKPPRRLPWYVVSPLFFLLGLLSKETAAVLPALLLLYIIIIKKEKRPSAIAAALAPYVLILTVYIIARVAVLPEVFTPANPIFARTRGYGIFLTMMEALLQYIRLSLFPTDLRVLYVFAPPGSLISPQAIIPALTLVLTIATAPWLLKNQRTVYFFILWFLVGLLPVSNIIPTEVIMTERAMYLPSIGILAALGILSAKVATGTYRRPAVLSIAIALSCLALLTGYRNPVWKDNVSVFTELVEVNRSLTKAYPDYIAGYIRLAQAFKIMGKYGDAEAVLKRTLKLFPNDRGVRLEFSEVYKKQGKYTAALAELEKASVPGSPGRDKDLTDMAVILYELGNTEKAEKYLLEAITLNPSGPLQHLNYGFLLKARGDIADALKQFIRAGELDPMLYEAAFQQGLLFGEMGDFSSAANALKRAAAIRPQSAEAHLYLGAAYDVLGDRERAADELERAIYIRPGYPEAEKLYERITAE